LHDHGRPLARAARDGAVRRLRGLPLPAADAPLRHRRRARAGAAQGRSDPARGRRLDRDGGRDPRTHLSLKRSLLLVVALALGVLVALAAYSDGKLGHELASFRWELFPLALALTTVNYALRFWRWQRYLHRVEIRVPFGRSLSIFTAGLTMTITPAK